MSEWVGVRCIGAPVFNWERQVVAAISVVGTTERITAETCGPLIDQVKQTALGLSRQLGYLGDGDSTRDRIRAAVPSSPAASSVNDAGSGTGVAFTSS